MTFERIYLVGFMGAGKTSVGRVLAPQLGWCFVDMDEEIEKAEKMAVREIFARLGELHFRQLESDHLKRISAKPNAVVALGGGAYVDPENRRLADSGGVTVWLKVSFDNVVHRVTMDGTRPLFGTPDRAKHLYEDRLAAYSRARIHVSTDDRKPGEVANDIVERFRRL